MKILRRIKGDEGGQSIVELAVVLPLTLLIIMGALTLGLLIMSKMIVISSATQGARYGAMVLTNDEDYGELSLTEKYSLIEERVYASASAGISKDDLDIKISEDDTDLTVKVDYTYKYFFLFSEEIFGDITEFKITHSCTTLKY